MVYWILDLDFIEIFLVLLLFIYLQADDFLYAYHPSAWECIDTEENLHITPGS